jgi:TRAP-type mannitol/chloroaromatic compound transport system permease small subunit
MAAALALLIGLPLAGQWGLGEAGSGPAEQLIRWVALAVLLIGLTLLPLGDRPA